jgi:hypothetical protein
MTESTIFIISGVVFLALIPLVPKMVRFRIAVLRWLHWNWFAELFERNFDAFTWAIRAILLVAGVVLVGIGIGWF